MGRKREPDGADTSGRNSTHAAGSDAERAADAKTPATDTGRAGRTLADDIAAADGDPTAAEPARPVDVNDVNTND